MAAAEPAPTRPAGATGHLRRGSAHGRAQRAPAHLQGPSTIAGWTRAMATRAPADEAFGLRRTRRTEPPGRERKHWSGYRVLGEGRGGGGREGGAWACANVAGKRRWPRRQWVARRNSGTRGSGRGGEEECGMSISEEKRARGSLI